MAEYVIELEGHDEFPTSISIIERKMYEREIGGKLENNPDIKIVKEYPLELKDKLEKMLGAPVMICPESKIFTVSKEHRNCIKRMFENI